MQKGFVMYKERATQIHRLIIFYLEQPSFDKSESVNSWTIQEKERESNTKCEMQEAR